MSSRHLIKSIKNTFSGRVVAFRAVVRGLGVNAASTHSRPAGPRRFQPLTGAQTLVPFKQLQVFPPKFP